MSTEAVAWAFEQAPSTLTPSQRLVLVAVAYYCDDQGDAAIPSRNTLSDRTGLSPTYVSRAVKQLEAAGLVEVDRVKGCKGGNLYRLKGAPRAPFKPKRCSQSTIRGRKGARRAPFKDGKVLVEHHSEPEKPSEALNGAPRAPFGAPDLDPVQDLSTNVTEVQPTRVRARENAPKRNTAPEPPAEVVDGVRVSMAELPPEATSTEMPRARRIPATCAAHVAPMACYRGVCVYPRLHHEFIGKIGGDPALAERRALQFYADTLRDMPLTDVITEDTYDFWRARFGDYFERLRKAAVRAAEEAEDAKRRAEAEARSRAASAAVMPDHVRRQIAEVRRRHGIFTQTG